MDKKEMVTGLKSGRTLIMDGWATEEERRNLQELINDDLVNVEFEESSQYGYYKITWKQPTEPEKYE